MKTHDAQNERIKRRYLPSLKEAKRFSESSLDGVAKAIHRFESYTKFRELHQISRFPAISYSTSSCFQSRPRQTKACTNRSAIKQSDTALDPKRAQSVFPVVGRPARLQIAP